MNDVILVGAGPVGLMLAGELRLAGVDVLVLEKLDARTGLSKALGVTGRGEDYLRMRGLLGRFRHRAIPASGLLLHYGMIPLDIGKTALTPKGIFVQQAVVEEVLEQWAVELGATLQRGVSVTGLEQDGEGVTLAVVQHGREARLRSRYVVGCDGARSVIRHAADIDFPGLEATSLLRLGDVKLEGGAAVPPMLVPLDDGWLRLITKEPIPTAYDPSIPMTLTELRESARRTFGVDLPLAEARWLSRFTDASRQAESYRRGRVFLAGDAAHIQLPAGGPGLLTGLGDALNLGWKLGAVVRGDALDATLDTYHADRHAVAARMIGHTRAQGCLTSPDGLSLAMRAATTELVEIPGVVEHLVRTIWQLDTRYRTVPALSHPLAGAFVSDATVTTPEGVTEILPLLRAGRWLAIETTPTFHGHVERLGASHVVGSRISGAGDACSMLIRPDGYVAWAGTALKDADEQSSLRETIEAWSLPTAANSFLASNTSSTAATGKRIPPA